MNRGWRHRVSSLWHRPVASLQRSSAHVYRWFQTPIGSQILEQELALIEQCRREYAGDVMLQVSGSGQPLMGKPSNKRQKIVVSSHSPRKFDRALSGYSWLVSRSDQIPLPEGTADLLVLHHVLEFSENPHDVLREAVRVLAPQGHLVVICFNPYSLFGLRKNLQLALRKEIPWAHHGLSLHRLSDWLHLMSCAPLNTAGGFYGFPLQWSRYIRFMSHIDRWLTQMGFPLGGFYVVHASKEVVRPLMSEQPAQKPRLLEFPAPAAAIRSRLDEQN